jgi:hypothetical protein
VTDEENGRHSRDDSTIAAQTENGVARSAGL